MAAPVTANASENSRACQLGWVRLEYGVRRNRVTRNKNTASTPSAMQLRSISRYRLRRRDVLEVATAPEQQRRRQYCACWQHEYCKSCCG